MIAIELLWSSCLILASTNSLSTICGGQSAITNLATNVLHYNMPANAAVVRGGNRVRRGLNLLMIDRISNLYRVKFTRQVGKNKLADLLWHIYNVYKMQPTLKFANIQYKYNWQKHIYRPTDRRIKMEKEYKTVVD